MYDSAVRPGEVHVHYRLIDPIDRAAEGAATTLLDSDERQRAARFIFDKDRHLFVLAHDLLRRTLSRYGDAAPEDWRFVRNRFGKPALDPAHHANPIAFNLAHTKGLAVCAVSAAPVGVDVEPLDRRTNPLEIAGRFFSELEAGNLERLPADERLRRFLDVWTLKEAYLKGIGTGMSTPLGSFSFTIGPDGAIALSGDDEECRQWQFALHQPSPDHQLAVAVRHAQPALSFFTFA